MYTFQSNFPSYSSDPGDIERMHGKSPLGIDLEFQDEKPTILGLSDGELHISVPYQDGRPYLIDLLTKYPETMIVGHNYLSADFPLLVADGVPHRIDQIEDSIIWWYLTNPHLSKSSGKSMLDEDGEGRRGAGFNNLWTMASVHTDFAHWKDCRGEGCHGPCPTHQPFFYNALDAAAPVIALPKMKRQAQFRGVAKLYPMHRELAYVLAQMQDYGVRIDVPYAYSRDRHPLGCTDGTSLDEIFSNEKLVLNESFPFNPRSPKAVTSYFATQGIALEDAREDTIREVVDDLGDGAPDALITLLDYKELGNGVDRWVEPQYRDKNGYTAGYLDPQGFVHPRLNFFTSSGRLACSSPNFQNVAKRRISRKICICGAGKANHPTAECANFRGESVGKKIRRMVIAPEGWYITRADLSNAENRYVLHRGGYTIDRETDLHAWVRDLVGIQDDWEIAIKEGSARNAAKSIQHANNILEGLQLKTPAELRSKKIRAEIEFGARTVCPDWTFQGKVVTFTGVNLARRVYGDATREHRRDALKISAKYFERFPGVREFQKEVSRQCEKESAVRTPFGYCVLSFGSPDDRMKIAQGIQQQNPVAHVTKLALLRCWERWKRDGLQRPILQVHDEILCYTRDSVDPKQAMAWLQEDMEISLEEVGGLVIPCEPSWGPNWRDQKKG